ncbi:MAG: hypothetical protein ACOZAL_00145 [Patescibacteria group bacterium]
MYSFKCKNYSNGFVAILAIFLVLVAGLVIILSAGYISLNSIKSIRNDIYSAKAYYTAEGGIEDALLRLINSDMEILSSYSLAVEEGSVTINIVDDPISNSKIITSQGNANNRIRKIEAILIITTNEANFHYGVQVGAGGLTMESNSRVNGNIYSNGPITGSPNAVVRGDAYSTSSSGKIDGLKVLKYSPSSNDGNAHANTILNSNIENGAYYQTINNTTAGSYFPGSPDPEIGQMPISEQKIIDWKNSAAAGGTMSDYTLGGNSKDSLGPIKIEGNLIITNNAILTVTGTIWVTGNITLDSNAKIKLDSSYGSLSDAMVANGQISISSNVIICGSEGFVGGGCGSSVGSYLMMLSTNSSVDPASPAIYATSNTKTAILYASQGSIVLSSNADLKEATAYALRLSSNAEVTYETGLADVKFTSGPGASWQIIDWKEIE